MLMFFDAPVKCADTRVSDQFQVRNKHLIKTMTCDSESNNWVVVKKIDIPGVATTESGRRRDYFLGNWCRRLFLNHYRNWLELNPSFIAFIQTYSGLS